MVIEQTVKIIFHYSWQLSTHTYIYVHWEHFCSMVTFCVNVRLVMESKYSSFQDIVILAVNIVRHATAHK